jgi:outer membrane lipoprotein-sorting protein
MEVWVRPDIWMFVRIRFDDKDGQLLKVMTLENIAQIDSFWTPHRLHVKNEQNNHQTIVEFSDVRYNIGIDNGMFSPRRLTKEKLCFRP